MVTAPGRDDRPRRSASSRATQPDVSQEGTERTVDRLIDEGEQRLGRSTLGLLSTGLLGGLDVGVGILALLIVEQATHNVLLAGLAFSSGFLALSLARSELFTEDFLVPVVAIAAGRSSTLALLRLWAFTVVTNLAGGWVLTGLVMAGFPSLRRTAVEAASSYYHLGTTWRAFALAMIGGMLITLMTHLQHTTESDGVRLVPSVIAGFVLGAGKINHAIVASLVSFAALQAGAPFGYADWLGMASFAALGNLVGGLALVTILRILQAPHKIMEARRS
jgi:formate/nitrite transporter FocA (FNT family)